MPPGRSVHGPEATHSFLFVEGCWLAAAAGAAAAHAAIAASVAHHNSSARRAARRVAHLVHLAHGVGRVINAAVLQLRSMRRARRRGLPRSRLRSNASAAGLRVRLAGHLVKPLGHFFSELGQVLLRGRGRLFGLRVFHDAGRGGQLRRLRREPANSDNWAPERKRRLSQRKM